MSRYSRLTTLEDAYFFLHCAISTPALPSSSLRRQRFLRGCILVAWTAVDDGVNNQWEERKVPAKRPKELEAKVQMLFAHAGIPAPDWVEFRKHKRARNTLTHPPAGASEAVLDEADVIRALKVCESVLRALYPDLIVWREWELA